MTPPRSKRPFMLDLFSGLKGASQPMIDRGWDVIAVDINPYFEPDICEDITRLTWKGRAPDLLWASAPCTEFTKDRLPWFSHDVTPDLTLARATLRIIAESHPRFWVVENVQGAVKYLTPIFGPVAKKAGSRYMWGRFPIFDVDPSKCYGKQKWCGYKEHSALKSKIPYVISLNLALAVEREMGITAATLKRAATDRLIEVRAWQ